MNGNRRRVCLVTSRYNGDFGEDMVRLCAQYARHLAAVCDLDVVTTCAFDEIWRNDYPEGKTIEEGIPVYRFRVDQGCNHDALNAWIQILSSNIYHDMETALRWLKEKGPYSKGMLTFIKEKRASYDVFLFIGCDYSTAGGIVLVAEKAILIPVIQNQEELRLCNYFALLFKATRGILYLNQEEREYAYGLFDNKQVANLVAHGSEGVPWLKQEVFDCRRQNISYIVGNAKDKCSDLIDAFIAYKETMPSDLRLVMVGENNGCTRRNDIIYTGPVTEKEWWDYLSNAEAFIDMAQNETAGMAALEAMAAGTSVIVSGYSEEMKQHILVSKAGLYYNSKKELELALRKLLHDRSLARAMGINGKRYTKERYGWSAFVKKAYFLIEGVAEKRIHLAEECRRYEDVVR